MPKKLEATSDTYSPKKLEATALPIIYKHSNGGVRFWSVSVSGDEIRITSGKVGTKRPKQSVRKVRKGKGKKTPAQQALANARSQWNRRLKREGFTESLAKAQRGERDSIAPLPMLAFAYEDKSGTLVWPVIGQPKMDGIRLMADREVPAVCLWTRRGTILKAHPHINHAVLELEPALIKFGIKVLDGEAYNHKFHADFSKIQSLTKQQSALEGNTELQFHVYDFFSAAPYRERAQILEEIIPADHPVIKRVPSIWVNSPDDVWPMHDGFVRRGFEGMILRNPDRPYEHIRTDALLKVKKWTDTEFPVVEVIEGEGKLEGHGIFICRAPNGAMFEVKMNGPQEDLKQYWQHPELFIGRELTVKHFGWTSKGKPRHAQGLRFRDMNYE
jgi:DNA ligase-1